MFKLFRGKKAKDATIEISGDIKAQEIVEGEYSDIKENENNTEYVIYVVADRYKDRQLEYFRECGLPVSDIIYNIDDAKNKLLLQFMPCRLIIIDSGVGKFSATKSRQSLIDTIGLSDDTVNITVFYTDSVLKVDAQRVLGKVSKNIDWVQYKSTLDTVADILKYKEKYVLDDDCAKENESIQSDITGIRFKCECNQEKFMSVDDIKDTIMNEENEKLVSYIPHI